MTCNLERKKGAEAADVAARAGPPSRAACTRQMVAATGDVSPVAEPASPSGQPEARLTRQPDSYCAQPLREARPQDSSTPARQRSAPARLRDFNKARSLSAAGSSETCDPLGGGCAAILPLSP